MPLRSSRLRCWMLTSALLLAAGLLMSFSSQAQTLTTLYSFKGGSDGAYLYSGLVLDAVGNFYGTTEAGGAEGLGTVFKVDSSNHETVLYSFTGGSDGKNPYAGLVMDAAGNLYGTTEAGGTEDSGTVFKVDSSNHETVLYSFTGGSDGKNPYAGLVMDAAGNLYGTTANGGTRFDGTVFKVDSSNHETVLHSFGGAGDGGGPFAGLIMDAAGNLYGTTIVGGPGGSGTVFKLDSSNHETILYSFTGGNDGAEPYAGLVMDAAGSLYGTNSMGGTANAGTVFKVDNSNHETVLYSFLGGADGNGPHAGLIMDSAGNLYGTTAGGGTSDRGTVFKVDSSNHETVLHSFTGGSDGGFPSAALVQANGNYFYSTTFNGGSSGYGVVFSLSPVPSQLVAVTPCRLVDTRTSNGGGPIPGGTYRTFALPQLAQSQGCADLTSASTYSLNVTLVPVDGAPVSYLTIWPASGLQPLVSTMNSLDGRIKANAAIVPAGANGAVNVYVTNTTNLVLDIDGYFAPVAQSTLAFYPLPPCRVADTRSVYFPQGLGTPHLSSGVARNFPMLSSTCIPSNVTPAAYSLNFTAVPYPGLGDALGYLELWPTDQQPPNPVSTLNNLTGTYVANASILPTGTNGDITAYASNDTDLLIDINGYFATAGQGGLSLYPMTPCRVFDSRKVGNGEPFSGTLSPPVNFPSSPCEVPATAQAYVFNATVVPSPTLVFLTLWPDGENQPVVSTLNAADGWITSNMAIMPTTNGSIDAFASGITQLILDISSYFAP